MNRNTRALRPESRCRASIESPLTRTGRSRRPSGAGRRRTLGLRPGCRLGGGTQYEPSISVFPAPPTTSRLLPRRLGTSRRRALKLKSVRASPCTSVPAAHRRVSRQADRSCSSGLSYGHSAPSRWRARALPSLPTDRSRDPFASVAPFVVPREAGLGDERFRRSAYSVSVPADALGIISGYGKITSLLAQLAAETDGRCGRNRAERSVETAPDGCRAANRVRSRRPLPAAAARGGALPSADEMRERVVDDRDFGARRPRVEKQRLMRSTTRAIDPASFARSVIVPSRMIQPESARLVAGAHRIPRVVVDALRAA